MDHQEDANGQAVDGQWSLDAERGSGTGKSMCIIDPECGQVVSYLKCVCTSRCLSAAVVRILVDGDRIVGHCCHPESTTLCLVFALFASETWLNTQQRHIYSLWLFPDGFSL